MPHPALPPISAAAVTLFLALAACGPMQPFGPAAPPPPPMPVAPPQSVGPRDTAFITDASSELIATGALSRVASTHARTARLRDLAQQITKASDATNAKLRALASVKDVVPPAELGQDDLLAEQMLTTAKPDEFDRAFLDAIGPHQERLVSLFTAASQSADPDVKALAAGGLPGLKTDLDALARAAK